MDNMINIINLPLKDIERVKGFITLYTKRPLWVVIKGAVKKEDGWKALITFKDKEYECPIKKIGETAVFFIFKKKKYLIA